MGYQTFSEIKSSLEEQKKLGEPEGFLSLGVLTDPSEEELSRLPVGVKNCIEKDWRRLDSEIKSFNCLFTWNESYKKSTQIFNEDRENVEKVKAQEAPSSHNQNEDVVLKQDSSDLKKKVGVVKKYHESISGVDVFASRWKLCGLYSTEKYWNDCKKEIEGLTLSSSDKNYRLKKLNYLREQWLNEQVTYAHYDSIDLAKLWDCSKELELYLKELLAIEESITPEAKFFFEDVRKILSELKKQRRSIVLQAYHRLRAAKKKQNSAFGDVLAELQDELKALGVSDKTLFVKLPVGSHRYDLKENYKEKTVDNIFQEIVNDQEFSSEEIRARLSHLATYDAYSKDLSIPVYPYEKNIFPLPGVSYQIKDLDTKALSSPSEFRFIHKWKLADIKSESSSVLRDLFHDEDFKKFNESVAAIRGIRYKLSKHHAEFSDEVNLAENDREQFDAAQKANDWILSNSQKLLDKLDEDHETSILKEGIFSFSWLPGTNAYKAKKIAAVYREIIEKASQGSLKYPVPVIQDKNLSEFIPFKVINQNTKIRYNFFLGVSYVSDFNELACSILKDFDQTYAELTTAVDQKDFSIIDQLEKKLKLSEINQLESLISGINDKIKMCMPNPWNPFNWFSGEAKKTKKMLALWAKNIEEKSSGIKDKKEKVSNFIAENIHGYINQDVSKKGEDHIDVELLKRLQAFVDKHGDKKTKAKFLIEVNPGTFFARKLEDKSLFHLSSSGQIIAIDFKKLHSLKTLAGKLATDKNKEQYKASFNAIYNMMIGESYPKNKSKLLKLLFEVMGEKEKAESTLKLIRNVLEKTWNPHAGNAENFLNDLFDKKEATEIKKKQTEVYENLHTLVIDFLTKDDFGAKDISSQSTQQFSPSQSENKYFPFQVYQYIKQHQPKVMKDSKIKVENIKDSPWSETIEKVLSHAKGEQSTRLAKVGKFDGENTYSAQLVSAIGDSASCFTYAQRRLAFLIKKKEDAQNPSGFDLPEIDRKYFYEAHPQSTLLGYFLALKDHFFCQKTTVSSDLFANFILEFCNPDLIKEKFKEGENKKQFIEEALTIAKKWGEKRFFNLISTSVDGPTDIDNNYFRTFFERFLKLNISEEEKRKELDLKSSILEMAKEWLSDSGYYGHKYQGHLGGFWKIINFLSDEELTLLYAEKRFSYLLSTRKGKLNPEDWAFFESNIHTPGFLEKISNLLLEHFESENYTGADTEAMEVVLWLVAQDKKHFVERENLFGNEAIYPHEAAFSCFAAKRFSWLLENTKPITDEDKKLFTSDQNFALMKGETIKTLLLTLNKLKPNSGGLAPFSCHTETESYTRLMDKLTALNGSTVRTKPQKDLMASYGEERLKYLLGINQAFSEDEALFFGNCANEIDVKNALSKIVIDESTSEDSIKKIDEYLHAKYILLLNNDAIFSYFSKRFQFLLNRKDLLTLPIYDLGCLKNAVETLKDSNFAIFLIDQVKKNIRSTNLKKDSRGIEVLNTILSSNPSDEINKIVAEISSEILDTFLKQNEVPPASFAKFCKEHSGNSMLQKALDDKVKSHLATEKLLVNWDESNKTSYVKSYIDFCRFNPKWVSILEGYASPETRDNCYIPVLNSFIQNNATLGGAFEGFEQQLNDCDINKKLLLSSEISIERFSEIIKASVYDKKRNAPWNRIFCQIVEHYNCSEAAREAYRLGELLRRLKENQLPKKDFSDFFEIVDSSLLEERNPSLRTDFIKASSNQEILHQNMNLLLTEEFSWSGNVQKIIERYGKEDIVFSYRAKWFLEQLRGRHKKLLSYKSQKEMNYSLVQDEVNAFEGKDKLSLESIYGRNCLENILKVSEKFLDEMRFDDEEGKNLIKSHFSKIERLKPWIERYEFVIEIVNKWKKSNFDEAGNLLHALTNAGIGIKEAEIVNDGYKDIKSEENDKRLRLEENKLRLSKVKICAEKMIKDILFFKGVEDNKSRINRSIEIAESFITHLSQNHLFRGKEQFLSQVLNISEDDLKKCHSAIAFIESPIKATIESENLKSFTLEAAILLARYLPIERKRELLDQLSLLEKNKLFLSKVAKAFSTILMENNPLVENVPSETKAVFDYFSAFTRIENELAFQRNVQLSSGEESSEIFKMIKQDSEAYVYFSSKADALLSRDSFLRLLTKNSPLDKWQYDFVMYFGSSEIKEKLKSGAIALGAFNMLQKLSLLQNEGEIENQLSSLFEALSEINKTEVSEKDMALFVANNLPSHLYEEMRHSLVQIFQHLSKKDLLDSLFSIKKIESFMPLLCHLINVFDINAEVEPSLFVITLKSEQKLEKNNSNELAISIAKQNIALFGSDNQKRSEKVRALKATNDLKFSALKVTRLSNHFRTLIGPVLTLLENHLINYLSMDKNNDGSHQLDLLIKWLVEFEAANGAIFEMKKGALGLSSKTSNVLMKALGEFSPSLLTFFEKMLSGPSLQIEAIDDLLYYGSAQETKAFSEGLTSLKLILDLVKIFQYMDSFSIEIFNYKSSKDHFGQENRYKIVDKTFSVFGKLSANIIGDLDKMFKFEAVSKVTDKQRLDNLREARTKYIDCLRGELKLLKILDMAPSPSLSGTPDGYSGTNTPSFEATPLRSEEKNSNPPTTEKTSLFSRLFTVKDKNKDKDLVTSLTLSFAVQKIGFESLLKGLIETDSNKTKKEINNMTSQCEALYKLLNETAKVFQNEKQKDSNVCLNAIENVLKPGYNNAKKALYEMNTFSEEKLKDLKENLNKIIENIENLLRKIENVKQSLVSIASEKTTNNSCENSPLKNLR